MPVPVGGVVRVTYRQRMFEQRILTVLHYRVTTASTDASTALEMIDLANYMARNLVLGDPIKDWRTLVCPELLFDEVRCQPVAPVRQAYQKAAIGLAGGAGETATESNTALSINKRTELSGRKYVGRLQMAGCPPTKRENGQWSAAYLGAVYTKMSWLLDTQTVPVSGGVYEPVLYHNINGSPAPTKLFDVQPEDTIRTMRRRTVRLGE